MSRPSVEFNFACCHVGTLPSAYVSSASNFALSLDYFESGNLAVSPLKRHRYGHSWPKQWLEATQKRSVMKFNVTIDMESEATISESKCSP